MMMMMMMNMSIKIIHPTQCINRTLTYVRLCLYLCVYVSLLYNIVVLSHILYLFIIYYNNCILWVKEHIFKDECAMLVLLLNF